MHGEQARGIWRTQVMVHLAWTAQNMQRTYARAPPFQHSERGVRGERGEGEREKNRIRAGAAAVSTKAERTTPAGG